MSTRPLSSHDGTPGLQDRSALEAMTAATPAKKSERASIEPVRPKGERVSHEGSVKENRDFKSNKERRRKGVSFLSRIIGNRARNSVLVSGSHNSPLTSFSDIPEKDDESEGAGRPEGMDACPFSGQMVPQYVKVRTKNKPARDLSHLFVAQRLVGTPSIVKDFTNSMDEERSSVASPSSAPTTLNHTERQAAPSPIWSLELSVDGRYLAAGTQDGKVTVWEVISHPRDRTESGPDSALAPVFKEVPVRVFDDGHTASVLDLSWSKNNFLISSSSDKTVRLWHVSRDECLCMFKHTEMIPSVRFHPTDDRFFLAGSLDAKIRLWSIPDRKVAFWSQLPSMITAVSFSPDGALAIVGTGTGTCVVFETKGLTEVLRIVVRSSRGKNSRGSRITSITTQWADQTHEEPGNKIPDSSDEPRLFDILIASNDSRIRLYRARPSPTGWTLGLEKKFKGHAGSETQMRASFGEDGRYVVSGSEDKRTFIWQIGSEGAKSCVNVIDKPVALVERALDPVPEAQSEPVCQSLEYRKHPVEMVESTAGRTTAALLAPAATRLLLAKSGDPVYELCKRCAEMDAGIPFAPPSSGGGSESAFGADKNADSDSRTETEKFPTLDSSSERAVKVDSGPTVATPARPDVTSSTSLGVVNPSHPGGHILICADVAGSIVVFRQDCAHFRRSSVVPCLGGLPSSMSDVFASAPQTASYAGSVAGRSSIFGGRVPSVRSYFANLGPNGAEDGLSMSNSPLSAIMNFKNRPRRSGSVRTTQANGYGSGRSTGRSTPVMGFGGAGGQRNSYRAPRKSQSLQNLRFESGGFGMNSSGTNLAGAKTRLTNTTDNLLPGLGSTGHLPALLRRKDPGGGAEGGGNGHPEFSSCHYNGKFARSGDENLPPTPKQSSQIDLKNGGLNRPWVGGRRVSPAPERRDRVMSWRSEVGGIV